jgi:penicillin-binding protein 2
VDTERKIKHKLKVYSYIVLGLLIVLLIKLAVLQLFHNEFYQTQAKDNRIRLLSIKAPRGEIYSCNGETLAANKLVFAVNLNFLGISKQQVVEEKLIEIISPYYPEVTPDYIEEKISFQKYRLFEPMVLIRDIPWDLVVKLEESRQDLPGVTITVEPLRYYPEDSLAGHVLGYIHSITQEELSNLNDDGRYDLNSLIGKAGVEKQYEQELRGKDGARSVEVDSRGRPIRELVTLEPHPGNNLYLTLDVNLQKVMENSMDARLKQLQEEYPKARVGSAVVLNVKTGEVLAMCSTPTMYPDDWKGSLSSERLSYYYPQGNYDPLNPGAELNRAIQAAYPPGSTFKPITGMAALEKGVMEPLNYSVNCQGAYWIDPYIKCTKIHGNVNYYTAMAGSCNTYFQEMGRRAGKEEIIRVGKEFGLGSRAGIDLPEEKNGLLPTPEWKKEIKGGQINIKYKTLYKQLEEKYDELFLHAEDDNEIKELENQKKKERAKLEAQYEIDYNFESSWQQFNTFNMSIGQGDNSFTVLQLANYVAAIANGGYLMKPYLVKKIVSFETQVIKECKPELIREVDVSALNIAETKRAMLEVTQAGGTAHFLFYHFPENIQVGAKTGSAETGRKGDNPLKEVHGVFIAFAPFDDPEIAFAGVVEYGGSGGQSAGVIARDVFEHYFGIKDHLAMEDEDTASDEENIIANIHYSNEIE